MSTHNKQTLTYTAAATALACAAAAIFFFLPTKQEERKDPIFSREIVAYEVIPSEEGEAVVAYEYKGEKVPEKLSPNEDVTRRTETSYHKLLAVENEGTKEEKRTYEGVFYSRPTFVKDVDGWHYIEHATTTETAFNKRREESFLASLFWRKAYAVTATLYSGAGDGRASENVVAFQDGCSMVISWNNAHDFGGDASDYTSTTVNAPYVYAEWSVEPGPDPDFCNTNIARAFVPIDTSSIPSGATISSATFNVYVTAKEDTDNDAEAYITVVQTSQAAHNTLSNGDYDACGAVDNPTEGIDSGQRKDITSISTSAYLSFTLNSTGLGWIKKSGETSNCGSTAGITCLGMREGHDATDTRITAFTGANSITFYASEQTGTSNDPYLSVTYTGGASFAFWQFQDF